MKPMLEPAHHRAALMLYYIVALNTRSNSGYVINRIEAAQILADLLQINRRAPLSWLRGDFKQHPLAHENFLKFIRAYQGKEGLESTQKIAALAVDLYGLNARKALDLLDPQDRLMEEMPPEKKDLKKAIFELIQSSPPEEVKQALLQLMTRVVQQSSSGKS